MEKNQKEVKSNIINLNEDCEENVNNLQSESLFSSDNGKIDGKRIKKKWKMPYFFKRNFNLSVRLIVSAIILISFSLYYILVFNENFSQKGIWNGLSILIVSIAIILMVFALLFKDKDINSNVVFFGIMAITIATLILRFYLFNGKSGDYKGFLSKWVEEMRKLKGVEAIKKPIGDYNLPYLYFLFFLSKTNLYDLYQIKLFSVVFDFILAVGVTKIVTYFTKSDLLSLVAFMVTLIAPTVFINSSYWGQCDSIYTAFCVWALYFALIKKPILSLTFFGIAFSFKMQTIFILPVVIFLFIRKNIKWYQLFALPVSFLLTLVPALICGRSFENTFSIYINQVESYPKLSLNSATLWALFPADKFEYFGDAALFVAGSGCIVFAIYLWEKRSKISDIAIFDIAFIYSFMMPYLLPRMHERYFFMAEILAIVYSIIHRKRAFIAPVIILIGFFSYTPFLFGKTLIKIEFMAIINLFVMVYIIKKFVEDIACCNENYPCLLNKIPEEIEN